MTFYFLPFRRISFYTFGFLQVWRHFMTMRRISRVAAALLLASLLVLGCSKEEKKTEGQAAAGSGIAALTQRAAQQVNFSNTLVGALPDQTVAFFLWQGDSPAYKKLMESPWGGGQSDMAKVLQDANKDVDEMKDLLKQAGLDPENKETWRSLFNEAAFFASAGPSADKAAAIGVVFHSASALNLPDRMSKIEAGLKQKSDVSVQDLKLAHGNGFILEKKAAAKTTDGGPEKMYFGWSGDNGAVGTSEWVLDSVLAPDDGKLPAVVSSPQFAAAAKGLPEDSARFATAFVDVDKLIEVAAKISPDGGTDAKKFQAENFPVKAATFSMAMTDTPQTSLRLTYDPADKSRNAWLKALNTSTSASLLPALPSKPLLFLSLDGQTLRQLEELALASAGPAGQAYKPQLAFLNNVKRVGLAARPAAPGQSMLPVPELVLVFESDDAAGTAGQLKQILGTLAQGAGVPGMQWAQKQINNVPVQVMNTPLNMGVYLATSKDLVVLSSSETQMTAALGGGGAFAAGLPERAEQVFANEQSLGNLYVNFEEVGSMMESMGGMLSMYAPPNGEANKLLQAENIESIKKMGTVVGSVKVEDGAIGIDSFYQQPKPTA
jgi:hypothetical protein